MKKHSPVFFLFTCLFTFLILNVNCLSNSKTEKIDELLSYCHERGMFNGCALIAEHGNKIYSKALGYIDYETREKLNTDTSFYIGSIAKQFTAMAIMMLKEQKKLKYDDRLSNYFPEFPSYAEKITVRHLLTHTAGIANYTEFDIIKTGLTNREVFNFLVSREKLDFEPGTKNSYSNGGYVLLAMIVEKVSGMSYPDFLKKRIFSPLKMDRAEVFNESSQPISNRAVGFTIYGDKNDYDLAKENFKKSLELNPDNTYALDILKTLDYKK